MCKIEKRTLTPCPQHLLATQSTSPPKTRLFCSVRSLLCLPALLFSVSLPPPFAMYFSKVKPSLSLAFSF